jgi:hypothetical protein
VFSSFLFAIFILVILTHFRYIKPHGVDVLGAGVEVLTDPTMLVQLPNGNDGLPAHVGVVHSHGI